MSSLCVLAALDQTLTHPSKRLAAAPFAAGVALSVRHVEDQRTRTSQTEGMEAQPGGAAAARQEEKALVEGADVCSVLRRLGSVDADALIKQVGNDVNVRCCTAAPDPIHTIARPTSSGVRLGGRAALHAGPPGPLLLPLYRWPRPQWLLLQVSQQEHGAS